MSAVSRCLALQYATYVQIGATYIDSAIDSGWDAIGGILVKFGLGATSILFDVIFLVQHYVLYRMGTIGYQPFLTREESVSFHTEEGLKAEADE